MDLKGKQLTIIKHYGVDKQLDLLIEECAELIKAICKFKRSKMTMKGFEMNYAIAEEMADVENVIEQFKLTNQELATMIDSIKDNKTNRQMHRIEKEVRP
jgi:NTP pyrophosphatase (non-canonical NTP hydrolase)